MSTTSMYSMEALDFRYLLLEYYKKLNIEEDALAVILMIDHLMKQNNSFITADTLSLKMNFKVKEIDAILTRLLDRELISYEIVGKDMITTLEPIRKKLYKLFQLAAAKDKQNLASEERSRILQGLFSYFEKRLSRTLSPLESDMLSTWLDDGYSEEEIKFALEESIASGKRQFKSVDRALRTHRRRGDFETEGYSSISDNWDKSIEETIAIAKTKWLTDDDDEEDDSSDDDDGKRDGLPDLLKLRNAGLYGAVIGRAYYTGDLSLSEAVLACERDEDTDSPAGQENGPAGP